MISKVGNIMVYETVTVDIQDNCFYITLNRPERLNSFDLILGRELYEVLQQAATDDTVKAIVIRGTGKGFCGGGDVKEMYIASDKPKFIR